MSSVKLVDRELIPVGGSARHGGDDVATNSEFSVMQFNILADSLSDSFPLADQSILAWSYRESLIVAQVTSRMSTVVCLEECDHFEEIKIRLAAHGYEGFFVKKLSETSQDGCAMFYRTDAVDCLYRRSGGLGGAQVALLAYFVLKEESSVASAPCLEGYKESDMPSSKRFFVAMTHLKAKVGFEEQRLHQVETLMDLITQYIVEDGPSLKYQDEDVSRIPIVVAGDFNEVPEGPAIRYMLENNHPKPKGGLTLADSYTHHPTSHKLPFYTTCKFRKDLVKRSIDYIFYNSNVFAVESILGVPLDNLTVFPNHLPCDIYPSDHLALEATFSWL